MSERPFRAGDEVRRANGYIGYGRVLRCERYRTVNKRPNEWRVHVRWPGGMKLWHNADNLRACEEVPGA